jgi:hypothetical protein
MEPMEHMGTGVRVTDPELDEALSRAIRQLIAEAIIEAGEGDSASAAALAAGRPSLPRRRLAFR